MRFNRWFLALAVLRLVVPDDKVGVSCKFSQDTLCFNAFFQVRGVCARCFLPCSFSSHRGLLPQPILTRRYLFLRSRLVLVAIKNRLDNGWVFCVSLALMRADITPW